MGYDKGRRRGRDKRDGIGEDYDPFGGPPGGGFGGDAKEVGDDFDQLLIGIGVDIGLVVALGRGRFGALRAG